MNPDTRLLTFMVWGIGTVIVYAIVLVQQRDQYRLHQDARSWREVLAAGALFITALGSAAAIALVLFGEVGTSLRGFLVAVSLGAFTGAGIVMADSNRHRSKKG